MKVQDLKEGKSDLNSRGLVSENTSRVVENQISSHTRRLSFHSPPQHLLGGNVQPMQRVQTPVLKTNFTNQGLSFQKKHSWGTPGSSQRTKKFNVVNKQNIDDFIDKLDAPKVSRFEIVENTQVLEFSKNKSKRRVKTINSSKTPGERPASSFCPFVSPFEQNLSKKPSKKQIALEDFHIIRKIGKGRFGNVFCALHKELNFICAIKSISKERVKKQKYESQLLQEIKIQSSLSHKNIVSLYGFFCDQQSIYLVLEYCSSGDLYMTLRKRKVIQQKESAQMLKQILDGLAYLHRSNILHRDLKPENIMIEQGTIKIGDFGWAASCENGLRKTFCGTPLYLSPQILLGEQYDQRTDIWALGILAYEMMVGSNPFRIKTQDHLQRIVDDEFKFPKQTELSILAKDFIERILQKNAKNRIDGEQLLFHPFVKYE